MRTLEAIVATLIGFAVFFGGCESGTKKQIQTIKQLKTSPVVQRYSLADSEIKISKKPISDEKNIDELIETSEDYIDYLNFRKKYSGYGDKIVSNIKSNNFNGVNNLIEELADKLENDPSKYAQQYLEKTKNYSYIIFEVSEIQEVVLKKEYKDGVSAAHSVVTLPLMPLFIGGEYVMKVISLPFGGKPSLKSEMLEGRDEVYFDYTPTHTNVIGKKYSKIRVTPYTGKREVLAENLPISQLKQELENYQNKTSK